jgi:hypothetical protein
MSNKDLYKMIDNLNLKINKLDTLVKNKNFSLETRSITKMSNQSLFRAYGINYPKIFDKNKKYIGLLFNENFNDFTSDNNLNSDSKLSFIKLLNGNNVINYSINVDIDESKFNNLNNICSVSLGIKEKFNSKVRIIKGSKMSWDIKSNSNKIVINNTIIYNSQLGEELCIIAELNPKCKINSAKSLFKILTIN